MKIKLKTINVVDAGMKDQSLVPKRDFSPKLKTNKARDFWCPTKESTFSSPHKNLLQSQPYKAQSKQSLHSVIAFLIKRLHGEPKDNGRFDLGQGRGLMSK